MLLLLSFVALLALTVPPLGGRLSRLAGVRFRAAWLLLVAVAVQVVVFFVVPGWDRWWHAALYLASYGLGVAFLAANRRVPGVGLVALGAGLNLLVLAVNGGVMPASPGALETAGLVADPGRFTNSVAAEGAPLWFLGDVFAVPWPPVIANVFSPGDLLIGLGAAVTIHRAAGSRLPFGQARWRARKSRTVSR